MREDLYARRYENAKALTNKHSSSTPSHIGYKQALEKLYTRILKLQMTVYCYCVKNVVSRQGLDFIKWNDWQGLVDEIREKEQFFTAINEDWRDMKYDEECVAAEKRHREVSDRWHRLDAHIAGLREAVEAARKERDLTGILDWLSQVDHSIIHNAALDKHKEGTGEWLVSGNRQFEAWKESPSSLLWLHGKGKIPIQQVQTHTG